MLVFEHKTLTKLVCFEHLAFYLLHKSKECKRSNYALTRYRIFDTRYSPTHENLRSWR